MLVHVSPEYQLPQSSKAKQNGFCDRLIGKLYVGFVGINSNAILPLSLVEFVDISHYFDE